MKKNEMDRRYKMTAVSYLNTKPLLYGIFQSPIHEQIELTLDIPSVCARKLQSGEADIGLVPVAVIPELTNPHIISDFCIGTEREVKTVCIFSDVPIQNIETLYLDFHSKTSVALTNVLLKKYWQIDPILVQGTEGYIENMGGMTAGLVIGDRTMGLHERFKYVYDLGEAWYDFTGGLPFVFAAWVSNQPLPDDFIKDFNAALQAGLDHIPQLMYILPTEYFDFDLEAYFTKNISYHLDAAKKESLKRFLSELDDIPSKPKHKHSLQL
jgi:chorismate dehydratase